MSGNSRLKTAAVCIVFFAVMIAEDAHAQVASSQNLIGTWHVDLTATADQLGEGWAAENEAAWRAQNSAVFFTFGADGSLSMAANTPQGTQNENSRWSTGSVGGNTMSIIVDGSTAWITFLSEDRIRLELPSGDRIVLARGGSEAMADPVVPTAPTTTLTVHGFVIGPADQSGMEWDQLRQVNVRSPDDLIQNLVVDAATQAVLSMDPTVVVGDLLMSFTAPPDLQRYCQLYAASGTERQNITTQPDTLNPTINLTFSFHYSVGDQIQLECDLWDDDYGVTAPDPIGRFVLQPDQLRAALEAGGRSMFYNVSGQTNDALWFVEVSMR